MSLKWSGYTVDLRDKQPLFRQSMLSLATITFLHWITQPENQHYKDNLILAVCAATTVVSWRQFREFT